MTAEHEHRPWGTYTVLDDKPDHKVKCIVVQPGARLSYQRHRHRSEHWFVVSGEARVTLDGASHLLSAGQAIDIPREASHRIENCGGPELIFIEIQYGDYFGEDDIERLDDDYGRLPGVGPIQSHR